ncbi:hypothetical protein KC323_g225 [Hortaea werneckii]|nr:hypothetical protein KC323_g225 [Hortaea werneckii]
MYSEAEAADSSKVFLAMTWNRANQRQLPSNREGQDHAAEETHSSAYRTIRPLVARRNGISSFAGGRSTWLKQYRKRTLSRSARTAQQIRPEVPHPQVRNLMTSHHEYFFAGSSSSVAESPFSRSAPDRVVDARRKPEPLLRVLVREADLDSESISAISASSTTSSGSASSPSLDKACASTSFL